MNKLWQLLLLFLTLFKLISSTLIQTNEMEYFSRNLKTENLFEIFINEKNDSSSKCRNDISFVINEINNSSNILNSLWALKSKFSNLFI